MLKKLKFKLFRVLIKKNIYNYYSECKIYKFEGIKLFQCSSTCTSCIICYVGICLDLHFPIICSAHSLTISTYFYSPVDRNSPTIPVSFINTRRLPRLAQTHSKHQVLFALPPPSQNNSSSFTCVSALRPFQYRILRLLA